MLRVRDNLVCYLCNYRSDDLLVQNRIVKLVYLVT